MLTDFPYDLKTEEKNDDDTNVNEFMDISSKLARVWFSQITKYDGKALRPNKRRLSQPMKNVLLTFRSLHRGSNLGFCVGGTF